MSFVVPDRAVLSSSSSSSLLLPTPAMSGTAPLLLALQPSVIPAPAPFLPVSSRSRSSWSRSGSGGGSGSTRKLPSHSPAAGGAPVKSAGDCGRSAGAVAAVAAACSCRGEWILLQQIFPAEFAVPNSPSLPWVVGVRSSWRCWNRAASSTSSNRDIGYTRGSSVARRRRRRRSSAVVGASDLQYLDSCSRPRLRRNNDVVSSSSSCGSAVEVVGRTTTAAVAAAESRGGADDDDDNPNAGAENLDHSKRRALSTTLLLLLSFSLSAHFRLDAAAAAGSSPSTSPVDFSPGFSGLKDWLKGQKQKTASFLLAPINASRERLASALLLVSSSDVSGASYEEAGGLVKVAARDCMPVAAGSILDFQKRTGVEVCTFKLVLKNAASLLDKGDPTKIKAEESLDDLIRSFVVLDGMLTSRARPDSVPDRKDVMGALDQTSGALNRFEAYVRACLGIA